MANWIEFVTSVDRTYWTRYGHRLGETFLKNTEKDVDLVVYHEGSHEGRSPDYLPREERILQEDLFISSPKLEDFLETARINTKKKLGIVPAPHPDERLSQKGYNYLWDAVTFCKKGFAIIHALKTSTADVLFWVDADVIFRKPIPSKFLVDLVFNVDVACFQRSPQHSETGFIGFNLKSPLISQLTNDYAEIWENKRLFLLSDGWTDCHALDLAIKAGEEYGLKCRNLSTQSHGHVIAASPLGDYIDHMKGQRKQMGYSPEIYDKWL